MRNTETIYGHYIQDNHEGKDNWQFTINGQ